MQDITPLLQKGVKMANEVNQVTKKKKWVPWAVGCSILAVLGLTVLCIVAVMVAILIPSFVNLTNSAEKALAETAIRNTVMAGETYRTENDGSYLGITAGALLEIDGNIRVVDGTPRATEVGISDISANRYVLTYAGESGYMYKATVTDGSVKLDFKTEGNSDLPLP
jgi:Tfp pilus assembly protein PilE